MSSKNNFSKSSDNSQSLEIILTKLTNEFYIALSRCEHCGKEGEVFDCDDCQANKVAFLEAFTDLLNLVELDSTRRFFLSMLAVRPGPDVAAQPPTDPTPGGAGGGASGPTDDEPQPGYSLPTGNLTADEHLAVAKELRAAGFPLVAGYHERKAQAATPAPQPGPSAAAALRVVNRDHEYRLIRSVEFEHDGYNIKIQATRSTDPGDNSSWIDADVSNIHNRLISATDARRYAAALVEAARIADTLEAALLPTPPDANAVPPVATTTPKGVKRATRSQMVPCGTLKAGDFIKYPGSRDEYVLVEHVELRPGVADVKVQSRKQPFMFGRDALIRARITKGSAK